MGNPKIGRSAHDYVRDQARDIVAAYRPVAFSQDGQHCLNPDDALEDQTWINTQQALVQVLIAMERFAETGKFDVAIDMQKFDVREQYRAMRSTGISRARALVELMGKYNQSQSTIERTIRENKEKSATNS